VASAQYPHGTSQGHSMESIFNNNKNSELALVITSNPTTSYKAVDSWLATNRSFFSGYCNHRKALGLAYANRNAIIWELINMINPQGSGTTFQI